MKSSVLLVSDVDFWRNGAGSLSRIASLVLFLQNHVKLTVVYLGIELNNDRLLLSRYYPLLDFNFLDSQNSHLIIEYKQLFKDFVKNRSVDVCIFEYIHLSVLTPVLSWRTKLFLDAHDIISDRTESFKQFTLHTPSFELSQKLEFKLLKLYDKILLLTAPDYKKVGDKIGYKKVLLSPHACGCKMRETRKEVSVIGFISSDYYPNIDGLQFFLENVWPKMTELFPNVVLNIYGLICRKLEISEGKNIYLKGFFENIDSVYDEIDVAINPVRFGAGLKIKNVEALANSRPLITLRHGSIGLPDSEYTPYLIADSAQEFIDHLLLLVNSFEKRKELSEQAHQFALANFSSDNCYTSLLSELNT